MDTQYILKKKLKLLAHFWCSFYRLAREYRNVGCLGKGKQGGGGLRAGPRPRSPQPTSFPRLPQQRGEALRHLLAWQHCPGMLATGRLHRCLCPNMRQIWSRGGKLLFLGKDSHRAAGELFPALLEGSRGFVTGTQKQPALLSPLLPARSLPQQQLPALS